MTRKQMFVSVLQALTLDALAIIASHYGWLYIADKVRDFEIFAPPDFYESSFAVNSTAWNNVTGNVTSYNSSRAITHNASLISTLDNATTVHTFGTMFGQMDEGESFWLKSLPKQIAPLLLLVPLNYYWMLWLERTLPGRRRWNVVEPSKLPASSSTRPGSVTAVEKTRFLEDEATEEEVVNALIAKGRVHRSSLSWCNTFLKWMADLSFGNMWRVLVEFGVEKAIIQRWTLQKMRKLSWMEYLGHLFLHLFCIGSLGNLVSFILVPAHKRIVFLSFCNLVWAVFFHAGLSRLLPWLVERRSVQEIIHNANEANRNASLAAAAKGTALEETLEGERPEL